MAAGLHEVDVHSNDIDGGGSSIACTSRGLSLLLGASPPVSGVGVFRINIVRAGACTATHYVVEETAAATDARIFQNNDLDPFNTPTALFWDESTNPLTTAAAVNALADMTVSGILSADALFASYPVDLHLQAGSACLGAGTPAGGPPLDMDGDTRDLATPDIGADEH